MADITTPKQDVLNLVRLTDLYVDKALALASQGLTSKQPDMVLIVVNMQKVHEMFALLKQEIKK